MQDQAISIERQHQHLVKVSRTFALTIPLLPEDIADQVSNAYLLCRIADTVEDDPKAEVESKAIWLKNFAEFCAEGFADEMQLLSLSTKAIDLVQEGAKEDEPSLIKEMLPVVLRTRSFAPAVRRILSRGVSILSYGMAKSLSGYSIKTLNDVDEYCYSVAGVVGELLACLFARTDQRINREELLNLSVSFGEGLQLTNILKDRKKDYLRGVSYLPSDANTQEGFAHYIALTKGHLDNALDFILHLPSAQLGIRRFCLLNICMAEATLKLMHLNPDGRDKISRRYVKALFMICKLCAKNNVLTKMLYAFVGLGLRGKRSDPMALRRRVSKWDKATFDILIEE